MDREAAVLADARERKFENIDPAPDVRIPVPEGWTSVELIVSAADPLGSTQFYRLAVFQGPGGVEAYLYVPDALSSSGASQLGAIVASIRPAR